MTELFTRLRFALACLQGRPVARHLAIIEGMLDHKPTQLTSDCFIKGNDGFWRNPDDAIWRFYNEPHIEQRAWHVPAQ